MIQDAATWVSKKLSDLGRIFKHLLTFVYLVSVAIILLLALMTNLCLPVIVIFIMVAAAGWVGGAIIGFLFGIPKTKRDTTDLHYGDNSNLEEVSDWVTKIIVGLTLVQLGELPGMIHETATNINYNMAVLCGHNNYYVLAYASLIFYPVAGIALGYIWTRTNMGVIFMDSRRAQLSMITSAAAQSTHDLLRSATMSANATLEATRHRQFPAIPTADFRRTIEQVYNSKPAKQGKDIQKGRWGGSPANGPYVLEAAYHPVLNENGAIGIKLVVRSIDPNRPLDGQVAFFLDDVFNRLIEYTVANANEASIELKCFEAFVVGARTQDGVNLEVDLRNVRSLPEEFRRKNQATH